MQYFDQRAYDGKYLIRCLFGLAAMVVAMRVTRGAGFAIILPLILVAAFRKKPESLLFLLVLSISMLIGNVNFMPKGGIFGIAQRLSMVLLSAIMVVQIAGQRTSPLLRPFLMMLLYLLVAICSSARGWCPFISYMKLLLFTSVYFAYYGVANVVATDRLNDGTRIRSAFLALACFFIFGSMALLPFPGLAQMRGEQVAEAIKAGEQITSLFTGMTYHSQTMGPVMAMLGTMLFADMVFGVKRADKLYVALLACAPVLIWKTSSRTALGAFMIGIMLCVFYAANARTISNGWKMKVINFVLFVIITLSAVVLAIPAARERVMGFVLKYGQVSVSQMTTADVVVTRQGKWDEGIANFKKSPLMGNGFQVSEDMQGVEYGLKTLSAPVEKSIWISAILEETGIVGFLVFLAFVLTVVTTLSRRKAYVGLICFLELLLVNLGEFVMFAMSAFGGFAWAVVFIGVMLDAQRINRESSFGRAMPRWR